MSAHALDNSSDLYIIKGGMDGGREGEGEKRGKTDYYIVQF